MEGRRGSLCEARFSVLWGVDALLSALVPLFSQAPPRPLLPLRLRPRPCGELIQHVAPSASLKDSLNRAFGIGTSKSAVVGVSRSSGRYRL